MKNIQVIDGANNCTYPIYAVTDDEFAALFPCEGQDIEFIEDVLDRLGEKALAELMKPIWIRSVRKSEVVGLHATLFYGLIAKKKYYPTKKDDEMIVVLD